MLGIHPSGPARTQNYATDARPLDQSKPGPAQWIRAQAAIKKVVSCDFVGCRAV
jgi:hypothetical protein